MFSTNDQLVKSYLQLVAYGLYAFLTNLPEPEQQKIQAIIENKSAEDDGIYFILIFFIFDFYSFNVRKISQSEHPRNYTADFNEGCESD